MSAQVIDDNGFIEIKDNPISMVGIFDYLGSEINAPDPSKMYKVFRSPEALSSQDTIDSFKGLPLVNDHTMLGDAATDPAKKGIDGTIGDHVYFKDGTLYGNLRLYTNKIKSLVKRGKRDLSLGYYSNYEFKKGTWNGQTYDAIQHTITGNHIALVDSGRCGQSVAVLDHKVITFDHKALKMAATTEEVTKIVTVALAPMMTTMDAMAKRLAAMDAEADKEEEKVKNEDEESEEDEDKVKSEDSDDEDKDDKKETMDAAAVSALVQKAVATANADLRKDIATKEELVKIASPLIGTFDHSTMSAADVAKYSADKLALTGDPETALRAYAKGLGNTKTAVMDAKAPAGKEQLRSGAYD